MNSSREAIYGALYNLLKTAVDGLNFVTISRRARLWTEVPPEEQPALFMRQVSETSEDERGVPNKWTLMVDVPIYVFAGQGANDSSAPLINAALDRIDGLFPSPQPGIKPQTLGLKGVSEVRIHGKIEIGENTLSGQGIAIVPIRVVAT